MLDFKRYVPSLVNEPLYVKTKYGVRTVEFNSFAGYFMYTDCTHPMQNCYCNPYDIEGWEYVNKTKMEELHFVEGWIYKEQLKLDGEKILSTVKRSVLQRIKVFILSLIESH